MNVFKFKSFKTTEEHLDQFYFEMLSVAAKSSLGKLLQLLFVLHNGQAEMELGFSINKALLENNMREQTIVFRGRIIDYMYTYKNTTSKILISENVHDKRWAEKKKSSSETFVKKLLFNTCIFKLL